MNRFFLLFFLWVACQHGTAQTLSWDSPCTNKEFCLNPGSCNLGAVLMTEVASSPCSNPTINYSYKIDLLNDGNTDISVTNDTASGNFMPGTHRITWRASDGCGHAINCSYLFVVKDCQPPNLLCINGLTQSLDPPDCIAIFPAKQFILNYSDNCTPKDQIQIGIREAGTGTGFPPDDSITFVNCQQGIRFVEIWVRDGNGLMNSCNNYVLVQPGTGGCICDIDGDIQLAGCVRTVNNKKLSNYNVRAYAQSVAGLQTPLTKLITKTFTDSCFSAKIPALPYGGDYRVTVRGERKVNAINGVSAFDLVLISKHILGIEPFTSMYQILAADVNASNSVTTFDIVEARKLVLGIYDSFPAVPSWRFIQPLSNPANLNTPFSAIKDTFQINFSNLSTDLGFSGLNFVALKMGDINLNADPFAAPAEDREPLLLTTADRTLTAGQVIDIPIRLSEARWLNGWQMALHANPEYLEIVDVNGVAPENYYIAAGTLRALWFDAKAQQFNTDDPIITLRVKVRKTTLLSKALTLDVQTLLPELYDAGNNRHALHLQIGQNSPDPTPAFQPPHPNPTTGAATFDFKLEKPATVQLNICNLTGQRIFEINTTLDAGTPSLEVPETALSAGGIFIWHMNLAGQVMSGKLIRQ